MKDLALLAVAAISGVYLFNKIKPALPKVNPASRDNFIYQASGEIGLKLADMYPSVAEQAVAQMLKVMPKVKTTIPGSGYFVPSNVYNASGAVDATGARLTPARSSSLDLYRLQYGDGLMGGLASNGRWLS